MSQTAGDLGFLGGGGSFFWFFFPLAVKARQGTTQQK